MSHKIGSTEQPLPCIHINALLTITNHWPSLLISKNLKQEHYVNNVLVWQQQKEKRKSPKNLISSEKTLWHLSVEHLQFFLFSCLSKYWFCKFIDNHYWEKLNRFTQIQKAVDQSYLSLSSMTRDVCMKEKIPGNTITGVSTPLSSR